MRRRNRRLKPNEEVKVEEAKPAAPKVKRRVVVIADFLNSELWQLAEGDVVEATKSHDDGWTSVVGADGGRGMVPTTYLEQVPEDTVAVATCDQIAAVQRQAMAKARSRLEALGRGARLSEVAATTRAYATGDIGARRLSRNARRAPREPRARRQRLPRARAPRGRRGQAPRPRHGGQAPHLARPRRRASGGAALCDDDHGDDDDDEGPRCRRLSERSPRRRNRRRRSRRSSRTRTRRRTGSRSCGASGWRHSARRSSGSSSSSSNSSGSSTRSSSATSASAATRRRSTSAASSTSRSSAASKNKNSTSRSSAPCASNDNNSTNGAEKRQPGAGSSSSNNNSAWRRRTGATCRDDAVEEEPFENSGSSEELFGRQPYDEGSLFRVDSPEMMERLRRLREDEELAARLQREEEAAAS